MTVIKETDQFAKQKIIAATSLIFSMGNDKNSPECRPVIERDTDAALAVPAFLEALAF